MIPGILVDFLSRASVGVAATRDAGRAPRVHFLSGWSVEPDGETVLCLVSNRFTEGLVRSLEDNGRVAMTAEVLGPHETYQFKGSYVDSRPAEDRDRPVWEACRGRFFEAIRRCYGDQIPDDVIRARMREPELAVRFRVEEIFVQTPGPAAGSRLYPREE